MPTVEALQTVDADDEDRVGDEANVVDMEELVVDWPTFPWLCNSKIVLANSELEQYILLDPWQSSAGVCLANWKVENNKSVVHSNWQ